MFPTQPLSTWDRATIRAVATTYRKQRRAGESDFPAYLAALAAYREHHAEVDERQAIRDVGEMIASVAREHQEWFWRGVGEPRRYSRIGSKHFLVMPW